MKKVKLVGTDITTSALGFGCAQLMRVSSVRLRQQLLNEAYDAGVCHFDVARMYGLGLAEAELGKFARGKRDKLVLATKFGIDLNPKGTSTARLQGMARRLIAMFPALRILARRHTGTLLAPRRYDAAKARSSLETSLRELGTDYVDLFLLHEPTLDDVTNSDVMEFLNDARSQGKIRAYGISGPIHDVVAICRNVPGLASIVQIPNDAITRDIDKLAPYANRAIITYSPFSNALKQVVDRIKIAPRISDRWSKATGKDGMPTDEIAFFLLRYCLQANPSGVVLFSTTKLERLKMLAKTVTEDSSVDSSLRSFLRYVDEEIRTPRH